jgi:hypothetical protein
MTTPNHIIKMSQKLANMANANTPPTEALYALATALVCTGDLASMGNSSKEARAMLVHGLIDIVLDETEATWLAMRRTKQ